MLKPKAAIAGRHFWDTVSDEQLADLDVTTDDPNALANLVREYPDGDQEPYVEYSYDLRGTDREEFVCIHGHHRHLKGFVFRKGESRFLVGWICGETLYGQKFDQYKSDFDTAVARRGAVIRVRELREAVGKFAHWAGELATSNVIDKFDEMCRLLAKMPCVIEVLNGKIDLIDRSVHLPTNLLGRGQDLEGELIRLLNETTRVSSLLTGDPQRVAGYIGKIREEITGLTRRANLLMNRLVDVEHFFQPAVLVAICDSIDRAVPRRRRHFAGLLKITTRDVCVQMPVDFKLPSRMAIDHLEQVAAA